MLTLWRQRQTDASWSQLIEALKQLKLNRVTREIEKRLKSPTELEDKMVGAMQVTKITLTQRQPQGRRDNSAGQQGTQYSLQEESSKRMWLYSHGVIPKTCVCMHQVAAKPAIKGFWLYCSVTMMIVDLVLNHSVYYGVWINT